MEQVDNGKGRTRTEPSAGVGRRSEPEGVDVRLHGVWLDALLLHLLAEEVGVVDSLSSREDLLASHEEVVRVGEVLLQRREAREGK
jgi:hypothetical protein